MFNTAASNTPKIGNSGHSVDVRNENHRRPQIVEEEKRDESSKIGKRNAIEGRAAVKYLRTV
jgi:hypothetical protein